MKLFPSFCLIACFSSTVAIDRLIAQGSLTPPGAPAPTMKTLDQIEARTDINKLAGDATAVAIITGPGSYYLSGDLGGAAGKDTIRIASAGRVSIDLNGFALKATGADRSAIALPAANDAVLIRNGTILAAGGTATRAIGGGGDRVTCEDLSVIGNTGTNIFVLGADATLRRCRLAEGGISVGDRSQVVESTVAGTTDISVTLGTDSSAVGLKFNTGRGTLTIGNRGLLADCEINAAGPSTFFVNGNVVQTGSAAVVRHCVISAGTVAGSAIGVGGGSIVDGCRVLSAFREGILSNLQDNVTVTDCSVQGIGRRGIALGENAQVRNCSVLGSGSDSILVEGNSSISGCTVSGAGASGIISTFDNVAVSKCVVRGTTGGPGISLLSGSVVDCDVTGTTGGAGIQVTQGSRVERNRSTNNGTTAPANPQAGIKALGANNRIEGNQLVGNAGFGIEVTGASSTGNLVIDNHARGNSGGASQFSIVAGNAVGTLVSTANPITDTHPSANYVP